ncbi:MAG: GtrA family protein [Blautia sp.]
MSRWVEKCYQSPVIRYVFFGGCTTMVNLITFYIFRRWVRLPLNLANLLSIVLAILFAYVVNSRYVFQEPTHGWREHLVSCGKFFGARGITMLLELGGVWLLVDQWEMADMAGKFLIQFCVLVLNYIFSRFFVFTRGKTRS